MNSILDGWLTDLHGPYPFTHEEIDKWVAENLIGNYALGFMVQGKFTPRYAGRSDTDLNRRLKEHTEGYTHFKFSCAKTTIEAYDRECKHYHALKDLNKPCDNNKHPDKPANHPESLVCGYCKV